MHISEGVLAAPVLISGAVLTGTFTVCGFKQLSVDDMPVTAALSSLMFIASFIHIPVGPASVHLVLNGLAGAFLGRMVFPAVFISLLLQALLFQFGGLTTLGVTTLNIAGPALLSRFIFKQSISFSGWMRQVGLFLTGFSAIVLSAFMVALSLCVSGDSFMSAAKLIFVAHFPVMVIEGVVTLFLLSFILKMNIRIPGIDDA
jgi:cobalt/nickel transport system permease protein